MTSNILTIFNLFNFVSIKKKLLGKTTLVFIRMTLYKKVTNKSPNILQTHINVQYQVLNTSQKKMKYTISISTKSININNIPSI